MSCLWVLLLFFGLQNNQRCCYKRENSCQCGCDERRNDCRSNNCHETSNCISHQILRNDNDCDCGCGCNDTFIQTRNYTNFQNQGTCGCEES